MSGMRDPRRTSGGNGVALAGTVGIHALAAVFLLGNPDAQATQPPPVYRVQLVAAPRPEPEARRAPEVVERPADEARPTRPARSVASETPPPPTPDAEREPAPRTTPEVEPLPDEEPSTGDDPATVTVEGVDFPYREYLANIVAQVYRRWQRPRGSESLRAEVMFFVRRDGSISNLQFLQRSGNFGFDLEAQGAIEAAGNAGAFGPLPEGFAADILPVSFFFDPSTLGRR